MTKAKTPTAAPIEMEQPRRGGSYLRRENGTLEQIEGAAPAAEPTTPPAPTGDEKDEG